MRLQHRVRYGNIKIVIAFVFAKAWRHDILELLSMCPVLDIAFVA